MTAKKKMSMKQAMEKYEKTPKDMREDRAGAKKLMAKSGKKMGKGGY